MRIYRISDEKVQARLKRTKLARVLAVVLPAIGAHLYTFRNLWRADWPLALGGLALILAITAFSIRWTLRRQQKAREQLLSGFEIEDDGISLTKRQTGTQAVTLARWEIRKLEEFPGVGFSAKSEDRWRYIWVPSTLQSYEELKQNLIHSTPAEFLTKRRITQAGVIVSLTFCAALITVVLSGNRFLVMASALFTAGFLIWAAITLYRNPHISRKLKWKSAAGLIILLASLGCALFLGR